MGKSETIEDKIKSDQQFREFMAQLEKESREEEGRLLARITETVERHYGNSGWDHARLFGDKRSDYQNYADWSLARVTNIIDLIGGALQLGDFPSDAVPGSKDASPKTVQDTKAFLSAFTGDYSLVIARVTALVTAALSQFAVASEAKRNTVERDLPMAGGMHLFFACSGNVFKREAFFTNQFLASFQIVFETYMSVDEARAIGLQQVLRTTATELEMLNEQILEVRQAAAATLTKVLKDEPKDYLTTKKTFDEIVESLKADRLTLLSEYDQYKSVADTVDTLLPELDLRKAGGVSLASDPIDLEHVFSGKDLAIAQHYLAERLRP